MTLSCRSMSRGSGLVISSLLSFFGERWREEEDDDEHERDEKMISVPQFDAAFGFSVSTVLQFVKRYAMNVSLERFVVSDVSKDRRA